MDNALKSEKALNCLKTITKPALLSSILCPSPHPTAHSSIKQPAELTQHQDRNNIYG
ncbi:hypothetical protein [Pantoea eucrina]|uniref:Uncharacterized protein n=1 Tax=Pantoea eucrina TaxID=472693 RepID=A0ABU5LFV4_9GAMM|nr:hypothetical protein [Pantoea eucrina]MDZ7278821.1 hypothetical protein [Pantoea eucrina]